MQNELGKVVEYVVFSFFLSFLSGWEGGIVNHVVVRRLVTPMFNDSHPRVRYAACQCV